jgi:poly-gamma-glutamate system protein
MSFNFSAKAKRVLGGLSLLSLAALLIVENNKTDVEKKWYSEKLEASRLALRAQVCLKNFRLQEGVFTDNLNDPNSTALIGQDITAITTDRGYIDSKLTATNPNFAAVVVDMLKEAGVKKGDVVAAAFTGSLPGLNIAVISAIQVLELKPVIISSVGASNWGANDPYFTWMDMEKVLNDSGIFRHRSAAASIGGGLDVGRGLSPEGRDMIRQAILRNNIPSIDESFLTRNIEKRMQIYNTMRGSNNIKAFINVGGGIASLGSVENSEFIPGGLSKILPVKNYPVKGVLIKMSEEGIPVIHMLNVIQLAKEYGLPVSPEPLPAPGTGEIFVKKQYNMLLTIPLTAVLLAAVIAVFIMEQRRHKLGSEVVNQNKLKEPEPEEDFQL